MFAVHQKEENPAPSHTDISVMQGRKGWKQTFIKKRRKKTTLAQSPHPCQLLPEEHCQHLTPTGSLPHYQQLIHISAHPHKAAN